MKNIFIERLELLLKKEQLSQKDLAKNIGITESAISKYLSGERIPNSDILLKIVTALNTTCDYLLGLNDNDSEKELNFNDLKGILIRNTKCLSAKEKNELIKIIVK